MSREFRTAFGGIKRSPGDIAFSDFIRERDFWTCQRCGLFFKPNVKGKNGGLDCSHFITRANPRTRFDEENAYAACKGCHAWLEEHPHDHVDFLRRRLGEKKYDALILRSNLVSKYGKMDPKLAAIVFRKKADELKRARVGDAFGVKA